MTLICLNTDDEASLGREPVSLLQLWDPDAYSSDDGYCNLDQQLFVLQPPEEGQSKWVILKLYLVRAVAATDDTIDYR